MTRPRRRFGLASLAVLAGAVLLAIWLPAATLAQQAPPGGTRADESGALVPAQRPKTPPQPGSKSSGPVNGAVSGGAVSGGAASGGAVSGGAMSGGSPATATLDYALWEGMASRAEKAIEAPDSTSAALEHLRTQLVDWREALLGAQNANAARIATLRTQIAALGPAPVDGATEAEEIAKRRSKLTEQLVRLQAPGIAAEEAYRRADGLIREIDRVLRERQASELLKLWPMPINPANWPTALSEASNLAMTLWSEVKAKWAAPAMRQKMADNLPLALVSLVVGLLVLWRGRDWIDRLVSRLQGRATERWSRIWGFLASLGLIVVPMLGVLALTAALQLTYLLGVVGVVIAEMLPAIAFPFFAALWLGGRVFPPSDEPDSTLHLTAERRAEGRILTSSFGLVLSVDLFRRVAFDQLDLSDTATSVLTFPIIVVAGSLLFRMGQLMQRHAAAEAEDERRSYRGRVIGLLARGAMLIGFTAPAMAAVGYVLAAQALVFPAAISLGLVGLLFVLQHLIGDVYATVMRSDDKGQDALVPVLAGFVLTLSTLPVFALIWGARLADITELWARFREGFTLGNTQVSPTDFLLFAVIFGIGYGLTRLLQGALKATVLPRTGLDQGGQNAIVSGLGYVGIFLAALIAINSTGIDLSGLAIVAGALSVGIGFGLQNIVSNFVSGIILLIERPVSEGDWIEVGGVQGIVKSISVRSTRIQTFDRSDVIVPNSDLISGRVTNWTRYNLSGRLILPVTVPFTTDSRRVEAILRELAEAQPLAVLNPPPLIVLMGFTAEAMQFEIRLILRDVNFSLSVRSDLNHKIAQRFAAEGFTFTNAHRDFLLRQAETAAVLALGEAELAAHEAAVATLLGPLPPETTPDRRPDPLRPRLIDPATDPTQLPEAPTL